MLFKHRKQATAFLLTPHRQAGPLPQLSQTSASKDLQSDQLRNFPKGLSMRIPSLNYSPLQLKQIVEAN